MSKDKPMAAHLDLGEGLLRGGQTKTTRLSDLRGCFADEAAYERALAEGDPVVYQVSWVEPGQGEGDLHYGVGKLAPGRIGSEYFLTRGHAHAWRPAAELYLNLRGEGKLLLEDAETGEAQLLPFGPGCVLHVPGGVAHRTINTGGEPLVYLGVYPARAGHEYRGSGGRSFRHVVVERAGKPVLIERGEFLKSLEANSGEEETGAPS